MRTGSRLVWLGLTPEPERELPVAVATLRARSAGGTDADPAPWIDAEVRRIEALILHGTQRRWLRYLNEVTALVTDAAATNPRPAPDRGWALHAAETVLDHHRMLIGPPGSAYDRVAAQRDALAALVVRLRADGGAR